MSGYDDSGVTTTKFTKGSGSGNGSGTVTAYPFPTGFDRYNGITVIAGTNNVDVGVIAVKVNNTRQWSGDKDYIYRLETDRGGARNLNGLAMFDTTGATAMEVTLPNTNNVVIRPLAENIIHTVGSGNKISFTLPKPGQYVVEWDNGGKFTENPRNALMIFVSPDEAPYTGTRSLGEGRHGSQTVNNGETLVLQPGAVVYGRVYLNSNAKVIGRGIITGKDLTNWPNQDPWATQAIETYRANGVEIRGVTSIDPDGWAVQLQDTENVIMDNFKIISSRQNSDGISIQSSRNVTVTNSFVRSWDDSLVVKVYTAQNTADLTFDNCVLWTDLAQSMEVGYETNKGKNKFEQDEYNGDPKIERVKFKNITVLHAMHKAPISIHNGDNCKISGVEFTNITIENYQCGLGDGWNYVIDFTNLKDGWVHNWSYGSIDVLVDGVQVNGGKRPGSRFTGTGGSINGTVKNVYYEGSKITNFNNGERSNITFDR
jgi:hypothetical protein